MIVRLSDDHERAHRRHLRFLSRRTRHRVSARRDLRASAPTIFSLQSEGVYDLRIRVDRSAASIGDTKFAGIWAYGLVGIPAGAIALLIAARLVGVDDTTVANALTSHAGVAGALHRLATCLGIFAATVVGGFLGLNLIRVVSDRLKAEIQREVKGRVAPIRLFDKAASLTPNVLGEDLASLVGHPYSRRGARRRSARKVTT
jgi:hypothetical protein